MTTTSKPLARAKWEMSVPAIARSPPARAARRAAVIRNIVCKTSLLSWSSPPTARIKPIAAKAQGINNDRGDSLARVTASGLNAHSRLDLSRGLHARFNGGRFGRFTSLNTQAIGITGEGV